MKLAQSSGVSRGDATIQTQEVMCAECKKYFTTFCRAHATRSSGSQTLLPGRPLRLSVRPSERLQPPAQPRGQDPVCLEGGPGMCVSIKFPTWLMIQVWELHVETTHKWLQRRNRASYVFPGTVCVHACGVSICCVHMCVQDGNPKALAVIHCVLAKQWEPWWHILHVHYFILYF